MLPISPIYNNQESHREGVPVAISERIGARERLARTREMSRMHANAACWIKIDVALRSMLPVGCHASSSTRTRTGIAFIRMRRSPSGPRRGPHMAMTRHRHRIDPASVSFLSSSGSRSFLSQPSAFRARCASIRTRSRVRS